MVMSAVLEIGGGDVVADANSARNPGAVPVNTIGPRIDLGELRRRRAARKAALEKTRRGAEAIPDTAMPAETAAPSAGEIQTQAQPLDAAAVGWEPPSWDDIVRDHSDRVYRLAYRLTGNEQDAEDLTQEVFIRVFRSLSRTTSPAPSRAGCTASPRTCSWTWCAAATASAWTRFPRTTSGCPATSPTPERIYADANLDPDSCRSRSTRWRPEFRAAVVLCDIEGLSYEEVATTLDVKLGTVRSRIHRGRSQLRAALEHRAPGAAANASGKEGRR